MLEPISATAAVATIGKIAGTGLGKAVGGEVGKLTGTEISNKIISELTKKSSKEILRDKAKELAIRGGNNLLNEVARTARILITDSFKKDGSSETVAGRIIYGGIEKGIKQILLGKGIEKLFEVSSFKTGAVKQSLGHMGMKGKVFSGMKSIEKAFGPSGGLKEQAFIIKGSIQLNKFAECITKYASVNKMEIVLGREFNIFGARSDGSLGLESPIISLTDKIPEKFALHKNIRTEDLVRAGLPVDYVSEVSFKPSVDSGILLDKESLLAEKLGDASSIKPLSIKFPHVVKREVSSKVLCEVLNNSVFSPIGDSFNQSLLNPIREAAIKSWDFDNGQTLNTSLSGLKHPVSGVKYITKAVSDYWGRISVGVFPVFKSLADIKLPSSLLQVRDFEQFNYCDQKLKKLFDMKKVDTHGFSNRQIEQIVNGDKPEGLTWHHNEKAGLMQLVDSSLHRKSAHTGGRSIWGGGNEFR